jgi:excinuclease ABC subunit C
MPIHDLKGRIDRLPEQPGVYLFASAAGETIYVGKARSLRDRVRSYLGARGTGPKTDALLDEAAGLEVIVTDSVVEALALENNLIKQRMPKYNILLRDDKNYPFLRLTTTEAFPRVQIARGVERDGDVYSGPYHPASLARKTMALTHRLFGIRSCNEELNGRRPRPCLEYDIKRCLAPCVETICSREEYGRAVEDTRLFLEGRTEELVDHLRGRMTAAAVDERFEQAAQLRDAVRTVETLRDRHQKMASVELGDRDVFGVHSGPAGAAIQVFQIREGRVIERLDLLTEAAAGGTGPEPELAAAVVLEAAVPQFYEDREVPPEIHLPVALPEAEATEAWLSGRAGRRVRLVVPKRGEKRGLLDLASRNATLAYESRFNVQQTAHYEGLETLRAVLGLPSFPRRIECFDISTIQGSETVASMVVCEDGRMKRSEYRKYRIKPVAGGLAAPKPADGASGEGGQWAVGSRHGRHAEPADTERLAREAQSPEPARAESRESRAGSERGETTRFLDDFAAMNQVTMRRYRSVLERGDPTPDLIVIDGGKGQLSAAYAALEELGLSDLVAIGLAKKEELVYTRDSDEPMVLARAAPALLLLQQIRDEAHRFAVTFHRQSRRARDLRSDLDAVPGIGPRRRRALLTAFGSLAGVRRASREDLEAVVGKKCANAVLAYFAGR